MRIACTLAALAVLFYNPAMAEVHEVNMLNRGETGSMVYEPDFLRVAPGDTVKFIATHSTHNAATIPGLLPDGASAFKGKINEQIEVQLDTPGVYGIQCIPHMAMGMVMLIQVGEPAKTAPVMPAALPQRASERLNAIVARQWPAQ